MPPTITFPMVTANVSSFAGLGQSLVTGTREVRHTIPGPAMSARLVMVVAIGAPSRVMVTVAFEKSPPRSDTCHCG